MRRPKLDNADWHVTLRGARRLVLFHEPEDFKVFYGMLGNACQVSGTGLFADCLLSNHFHLGLSGGSGDLTRCMQRLDRAYSGYHNAKYGLTGHAFERAYYSGVIPSDFILQRVTRYIHLNPVRAGRTALPEDYPWSDYRQMITARPEALSPAQIRVLQTFGGPVSTAQKVYRDFVLKDLSRKVKVSPGKTTAWELWQEQFRWILEFVIEQQERIFPLAPERVAVYLGSKVGIPPRVMGNSMGHPDGRKISQMIFRMNETMSSDSHLRRRVENLEVL